MLGEANLEAELANEISVIRSDLKAQQITASGIALSIAGIPDIADLILNNEREEIVRRFRKNLDAIKSTTNIQLVTFSTASARIVARVHTPDNFGDDVSGRRKMIVQVIKEGKLAAGLEPGRDALAIFASAPVFKDDHVVGVVDIGTSLKSDYFNRLKVATKADIAVRLANGDRFDTQNSTYTGEPVLSRGELRAILNGETVLRMVESGGKTSVVGGMIIEDFSGSKIGVLEVASNVTMIAQGRANALWLMGLATVAICGLVLAAFLFFARALTHSMAT